MPSRSRPSLASSLRPSSREDVDVTGFYVADEVLSLSSEADEVGDEVHLDPSENAFSREFSMDLCTLFSPFHTVLCLSVPFPPTSLSRC